MRRNIQIWAPALFSLLSFARVAAGNSAPPPPVIHSVELLTPVAELYGKFEARISLTASYTNPYDYSQVAVSATFAAPSGEEHTVDGFFMQDYVLNEITGNLTPTGPGGFRVRFSPGETGAWHFAVKVVDATGMAGSEPFAFQCADITTPANHGFLSLGPSNYLQFEDGAPYIAIGENMAWQNNNTYLNYKSWLSGLISNGGNYFRLWHAHWGLGIEWRTGNGFEGLRRYRQNNCYYQDWLFDYCAENGVYIMLALQHHGPVSTQVNPNWGESPYNVANGGPCQNTIDFFTNAEARAHTKNRFRYIVARWGYARSILCWELFNEVLWTDNFQANKDLVAAWHYEMAAYLKSIDPYGHIITTSYGDDFTDENVWSHPDIGFTQSHVYINTPNIERALAMRNRGFLQEFGKPALNGEFGLGGTANLANEDPDGIHLHNSLWGGLFSGAFGTAMTWWWDNYIHPRDLYYHFSGLAAIAAEVPFQEKQLSPADAFATGAPGNLVLAPTLSWGGIGTGSITIGQNGQVSPSGAELGQFLYGAQWNTQYRSPPTFSVQYPSPGGFTVRTSGEAGTNPRVAIWLDGNLSLEQAAVPNTSYTVSVPAGAHTIKVDNTGTDWITITSYTFEGLGSLVDAYVLVSHSHSLAAGWALNNTYNHQYVAANGLPAPTPSSTVAVQGFQDGLYTVRLFSPMTGAAIGTGQAQASGGLLSVPLPSFLWDIAFIVDDTPVAVAEPQHGLGLEIYPNPAKAGSLLQLAWPGAPGLTGEVSLLTMDGREAWRLSGSDGSVSLPATLPAGQYWVKVVAGGRIGVLPLVVAR
ncbi:MAG: DUF5060 domain-containing protein [Lewinellaceae bacterium]|nr:DUF5060 domain-containing protein [Lewinellaceae bacterium]